MTNPDSYLPQAHTCFFSMELPEYSSEQVMRERLLYAITECVAIDTDYIPGEMGSSSGYSSDSNWY